MEYFILKDIIAQHTSIDSLLLQSLLRWSGKLNCVKPLPEKLVPPLVGTIPPHPSPQHGIPMEILVFGVHYFNNLVVKGSTVNTTV